MPVENPILSAATEPKRPPPPAKSPAKPEHTTQLPPGYPEGSEPRPRSNRGTVTRDSGGKPIVPFAIRGPHRNQ